MSDIFYQYKYLKKFWSDFYGYLSPNKQLDEMIKKFEGQLDKKMQWELIQLIDQMNLECERTSLESFVSGFRTAMGIAREVSYETKFLHRD